MKMRLVRCFSSQSYLFLQLIVSFWPRRRRLTTCLANGDFEGEFVELEGAEPRNVASGWLRHGMYRPTDSSPSFANHDPNYDEETDRIRLDEAGSAQKYFTLFATHQGGIYQEVDSATSGATYRFSIYAYVWSSSFEDADVSEDPGDGRGPRRHRSQWRNRWQPAKTLFGRRRPPFFYDAYRQYAVIATAESSTITVFVESTVGETARQQLHLSR